MNVTEIQSLVNRPRSKLVEIWNRDSIHEWTRKLQDPLPPYKASARVKSKLPHVLMPGEKCSDCKVRRTRKLNITANLGILIWAGGDGVLLLTLGAFH